MMENDNTSTSPKAKKRKTEEHDGGYVKAIKHEVNDSNPENIKQFDGIKMKKEEENGDNDELNTSGDYKEDKSRSCPYLDTINRNLLDFDFEKLCSVSLSHLNVYACLVCGKYFQGRGKNSHAYTHSVNGGHHVYLNLHTLRFYCLPDNYEIIDSSLSDIKYVLNPTFTKGHVSILDRNAKLSMAYDGTAYYPGIVGLNNIKANDYCNVVLQALSHVSPLRNYFLRPENYMSLPRPPGDKLMLLSRRFGELLRKLWNPRQFKAHVSPHEMLQAVVLVSNKMFQITQQGDAIDFLSWFLNTLHSSLNGSRKQSSSIINKVFRGSLRVYSKKVLPRDLDPISKIKLLASPEYHEKTSESPFLYLTVDLPAPPLFKNEMDENIIPQVPLHEILAKFNGQTEKEYVTFADSTIRKYEITRLPPYLILYIKRFTKNNFYVEKNPTIVNFPISQVDLGDYIAKDCKDANPYTCYDLMANIVHDGSEKAGGTYRAHINHKGTGKWFEMQDLHVTDVLPQMIPLSEAYIQIYELNQDKRAIKMEADTSTTK